MTGLDHHKLNLLLLEATKEGDLDKVKEVISKGASSIVPILAGEHKRECAFNMTCSNQYLHILKYFLEQEGPLSQFPLITERAIFQILEFAIEKNLYATVLLLLNHLQIKQSGLTSLDKENLLTLACRLGHLDIVKFLIGQKAFDPNKNLETGPEKGLTPLFAAVCHGKIEVVRYLVEERVVDPNEAIGFGSYKGQTPLSLVVKKIIIS